jgi:predicted metalloprotease with PDZ domain
MISYRLDIEDVNAHLFRVTMRIPRPTPLQSVSLPVWLPGLYLILDTPRNLQQLDARQGTRKVALTRVDKATWQAQCTGSTTLTLTYLVYAFDATPRTAFLDALRGFFNGCAVFLCAEGRRNERCRLELGPLPPQWQVATSMPTRSVDESGQGVYEASDYDELADHPFELGTFWRGRFEAGGVPHEIAVTNAFSDFDGDRLIADAKRTCEAAIAFWHDTKKPPFDRFVFLLNVVDEGLHGLEHRASTALTMGRRDLPRQGRTIELTDGYASLVALFSHEYFHAWNVKRLMPQAFTAYDYSRETYTDMLWFFEGFTSYFDELLLHRCGFYDTGRYMKALARSVNRLAETPGQHVQTMAQASFESWLRTHRMDENTNNAAVSYYTKGCLTALLLDLNLRRQGRSLDEVMRLLWERSGGGVISETDFRAAVNEVAGRSMDDLIDAWVHSTAALPLRQTLEEFGVYWRAEPPGIRQRLGLRFAEGSTGLRVTQVLRGMAGERAGFSPGDEIVAIDGWRMRRIEDALHIVRAGNTSTAVVARDRKMLTLTLTTPPEEDTRWAGTVVLSVNLAAAEAVQARRLAWLTGKPPAADKKSSESIEQPSETAASTASARSAVPQTA